MRIMIKKMLIGLLSFLIPFFLICSFSFASELDEFRDKAQNETGFSDFLENLPDDSLDFFEQYDAEVFSDDFNPNLENVVKILFSVFLAAIKEHFFLLSTGFGLVLLFKVLSGLFVGKERLLECLTYLSVISCSVFSFGVLEKLLSSLAEVTEEIASFLTSALPVIASAQILAGSESGAGAVSSVLPIAFTVISWAVPVIYTPLCIFCYAASLSGFYRDRISLRPFVQSVKTICSKGVELLSGLAVGVFFVRRASVFASNAMAQKGVRFALVRMLPLAGGALTDGLETVYACGKSISGKTGIICVVVIFSLLLSPCVLGLLFVLFYSILSTASDVFGVSLLSDFFAEMKDIFSLLTSFSLCSLIVLSSGLLLLSGG